MIWQGQTEGQRHISRQFWRPYLCLFPEQMVDGRWVWLQWVETRDVPTHSGRYFVQYRLLGTRPDMDDGIDPREPLTEKPGGDK